MSSWDSYRAEAKARGALAMEVFVAVSTPVAPPEEIRAVLPDHLAYIRSLEAQGALMMAGPLSDETGMEMQSMGMLVLRADTMEAAHDLAAQDPMHLTGCRSFTLRRWLINEGSLSMTVGLSGRTIELG